MCYSTIVFYLIVKNKKIKIYEIYDFYQIMYDLFLNKMIYLKFRYVVLFGFAVVLFHECKHYVCFTNFQSIFGINVVFTIENIVY